MRRLFNAFSDYHIDNAKQPDDFLTGGPERFELMGGIYHSEDVESDKFGTEICSRTDARYPRRNNNASIK